MKAELIAVGTELLLGQIVNSNAAYLSEELNKIGISVFYHSTVGDNPERMKEVFDIACSRSDLVICTGGLGPTADDITNEAWANFFGVKLKENQEQKEKIKAKFAGREMPGINLKQAMLPEGAEIISNNIGTAPGVIIDTEYKKKPIVVMTFPGVPCEMKDMFQAHAKHFLQDKLQERGEDGVIISRDVRLTNITESQMAEKIEAINLFDSENPTIAPYATIGECRLRITAKATTEHKARNLIQSMQFKVEQVLGDYIYGYDEDTIPRVLAKELIRQGLKISFAESCTGGLLSKIMTDIPGSSAYTTANFVTYSNEAKARLLNIDLAEIEKHGAVSEETARAMAEGLNEVSDADINVSVTGIAGPDGGTKEKPVGLVYLGLNYKGKTTVEKLDLSARPLLTRQQIRDLTAKRALHYVCKML